MFKNKDLEIKRKATVSPHQLLCVRKKLQWLLFSRQGNLSASSYTVYLFTQSLRVAILLSIQLWIFLCQVTSGDVTQSVFYLHLTLPLQRESVSLYHWDRVKPLVFFLSKGQRVLSSAGQIA